MPTSDNVYERCKKSIGAYAQDSYYFDHSEDFSSDVEVYGIEGGEYTC